MPLTGCAEVLFGALAEMSEIIDAVERSVDPMPGHAASDVRADIVRVLEQIADHLERLA